VTQADKWESTRFGGLRRTARGSSDAKNTTQITWRSESRKLPPGPKRKWAVKWREPLGLPTCPYVIRWRLETPIGSIRLHHWLASDDDRAFHDHPWWFTTFVLKGGYTDRNPEGDEHLKALAVRYRPALHQHTVVPDSGGAWTIIVTGPIIRKWGFWFGQKFVKANKWFASRGHHPCS
jgi:hypothetical protein